MNLALGAFVCALTLCQLVNGADGSTDTIGVCGKHLVNILVEVCKDYGGPWNERKRSDPYREYSLETAL